MKKTSQEVLPPITSDGARELKGGRLTGVASAATATDALKAVTTIITAVTDARREREEHRTMRDAIRERSSVMREQISANRQTLDTYVARTFDGRDQAIGGLLDALDAAITSGNVDLVKSVGDSLASVVTTGPLIQAAELHQNMTVEESLFKIGGRDKA